MDPVEWGPLTGHEMHGIGLHRSERERGRAGRAGWSEKNQQGQE